MGARCAADYFPRRHYHGDRGPSQGLRQGRIGTHPAVDFRLAGNLCIVVSHPFRKERGKDRVPGGRELAGSLALLRSPHLWRPEPHPCDWYPDNVPGEKSRMAKVTLVFAALLIALGLAGFLGTGSAHPTALIPTWIGLALGVFGFLAMSPSEGRRKLFMHINVTIGLLGFLGGAVEAVRGYL